MKQNELQHYGVLGMKWGKRRSPSELSKARSNRQADKQVKKTRRQDVKNRRLLSDEDLNSKIGRLEKEKKLKELTDNDINSGRKVAKDVMKTAGTKTITTVASGATLYAVKTAMTKEFDIKDAAGYVAPKPGKK